MQKFARDTSVHAEDSRSNARDENEETFRYVRGPA